MSQWGAQLNMVDAISWRCQDTVITILLSQMTRMSPVSQIKKIIMSGHTIKSLVPATLRVDLQTADPKEPIGCKASPHAPSPHGCPEGSPTMAQAQVQPKLARWPPGALAHSTPWGWDEVYPRHGPGLGGVISLVLESF